MNIRKNTVLLLIVFTGFGCSTSVSQSRAKLTAKPDCKSEFDVARPYQSVYVDVKRQLMDYKAAWPGNEWLVDGYVDEYEKTADVTCTWLNMAFGANTYLYVTLKPIDANSCSVSIYGLNQSGGCSIAKKLEASILSKHTTQ
jgi:hypothetical protein